jgi:hypothetical protein
MSSPTSSSARLLCVLVKSGKIQVSDSWFIIYSLIYKIICSFFLIDDCYSYVVLKIDNVKSSTSIQKGQQPSWEQEFYL